MSIDYTENELWWIAEQNKTFQILFCRLGSLQNSSPCNASSFLPNGSAFEILTSIAVDDGVVYYARDGRTSSLESIGKDGKNHRVICKYTPGVTALKIYHRHRLTGGISHFVLKAYWNAIPASISMMVLCDFVNESDIIISIKAKSLLTLVIEK